MKKIIFFACAIFLISLFARITSYLDVVHPYADSRQYYQGIGSGNDADYQIQNAIFAITHAGPVETLTHYDYIFLIPLITLFIKQFGYIPGIEYLMYLTIFLGSCVPVIIFFLLAQRNKFLVGSLFAGLALALNPLLINVSAGRFILDTLVQFLFALFIFCFVKALEKRSLLWLILLGVMGVIQGLNKPFLIVNDMVIFLILPLFFLIKDISFRKDFPFIDMHWYITKKIFLYALIPTLIYFLGNLAWEAFTHIAIHRGYFLSDIFFSKSSDSSTNFALRDSLASTNDPLLKIRNIIIFTALAIEQLLTYINLPIIFSPLLILFYALTKKRKKRWILWTIIITLLLFVTFYLIAFFFGDKIASNTPQSWSSFTFFQLTMFTLLLLFFIQRSKTLFATTISQLPYLAAVGITITTAIGPRHYLTLVIWFIVCLAIFIDSFASKLLAKFSSRTYYITLIGVMLLFILPFFQTISNFTQRVVVERTNQQYLSWVKEQVPENGFILAGTEENLINIAKYTERPVLYNAFHVATIATYTDSVTDIKSFGLKKSRPMEFKEFLRKYVQGGKLFITDLNKSKWEDLLSSGGNADMGQNKYVLKAAAKDPRTNRLLYLLVSNEKITD